MKKAIFSPKVARVKSPLAHAVKTGNLVYVSGLPGFDQYGDVAIGDFKMQCIQALANLRSVLLEAGSSLEQVVKVNIILDRISDFEELNDVFREYFGTDEKMWPARTTIQAQLPRPDFLIEIECVAEV